MQNHPLTPMIDPNLVRVMQSKTRRKVGLIDHRVVAQGEAAIRERIQQLRADGVGVAIVDAVSNDDLLRMGPALKDMPLITAGSGVAIGLPANFGLQPSNQAGQLPPASGLQAVVSGSCSLATLLQVAHFRRTGRPAFVVDALRLAAGEDVASEALAWAAPLLSSGPVLVYSTAETHAIKNVQGRLGVEDASTLVEHCMASIARGLVQLGCVNWWWLGVKRRALACRPLASRKCKLVRKLTLVCRGPRWPPKFPRVWPLQTPPPELIGNGV